MANRFIDHADEEDGLVTILQLVKFVYFAHGWTLAVHDQPLIYHPIEVWPYGPVVYKVYRAFRPDPPKPPVAPVRKVEKYSAEFSENEEHVIRRVYETYSVMSPFALSELTHKPGTPWAQTRQHGLRAHISNKVIKGYFLGLIRQGEERERLERERQKHERQQLETLEAIRNEPQIGPVLKN